MRGCDHTMPVAIYAWLRHPNDVVAAVTECVRCGGDTDSVAAIAGVDGIPRELLDRLFEWPRTPEWIAAFGERSQTKDVPLIASALRNLVLLAIVLAHGLRRMLPPY
ncbi:MAG TPA: ADP-ribosylglycohydrolase family protein [Thermoanaerobaculia bacterium]|nr:ADP-ribosylglycohydrolase family protein [Thermoanaerobaculia bacterium]